MAIQVKDDNSMHSSNSSRVSDVLCFQVSVEGILLRENKRVKDDVIVLNLTSQVNGGTIAELMNAEGRDQLWGRSGILFCSCHTEEAYMHL